MGNGGNLVDDDDVTAVPSKGLVDERTMSLLGKMWGSDRAMFGVVVTTVDSEGGDTCWVANVLGNVTTGTLVGTLLGDSMIFGRLPGVVDGPAKALLSIAFFLPSSL